MKLQLTISSGTLAGQSYDLETGFMSIGRSDTCTVRFDPMTERIASKQHAFIEARADGYYVTDNQSTNGTFVNGQQVTSQKLNSGDQIQFGANGVTASISIEGATTATPAPSFREHEIQQFNQTVAQEPVSVQSSLSNFGLNSVSAVKVDADKNKRYIGIGVTLFALIFLLLVVTAIMFLELGPVAAVMATFVAFVPATIYIIPLVWLDRYDPEPVWLLALAFAWGALVSVIVAFFVNSGIESMVSSAVSREAGGIVGLVVSAPVVEEGAKGIGVIILLVLFRRYFDDILDGIVFAAIIALGFATTENILYYGRAMIKGGAEGLAIVFVIRGIMAPFSHAVFTSMTGIGAGISRESHNVAVRVVLPVLGYIVAVCLHAIWNGSSLFVGSDQNWLIFYAVLEFPFFLIMVGFSLYIMRRQRKILNEMLAIDIARGLIPEEHAKKATSAFRSSGWIIGGLFNGKFKARSNYVRSMGKLGLSYWHIQRATAAQGHTGSFQQNPILRDEVLKWRDKVD